MFNLTYEQKITDSLFDTNIKQSFINHAKFIMNSTIGLLNKQKNHKT